MLSDNYLMIGWLIIIIGWLVSNHQNNSREDRKELRASLDNIIEEIHNIHLKSIDYYTSPIRKSAELAFEIKSSQARLIKKIERLSKLHNGFFKVDPLVNFMDVITGGDFENSSRKIRKFSDKTDMLLYEISFSTDSLIDMLEYDFCRLVRKNSWLRKNF